MKGDLFGFEALHKDEPKEDEISSDEDKIFEFSLDKMEAKSS
jgi:hypothetical protein